ncbi:MAG: hypothetical protein WD317_05600 [Balneolaceae bacterium]
MKLDKEVAQKYYRQLRERDKSGTSRPEQQRLVLIFTPQGVIEANG